MFSDSAGVKMTIFVDLSKGLMRKKEEDYSQYSKQPLSRVSSKNTLPCNSPDEKTVFVSMYNLFIYNFFYIYSFYFFIRAVEYDFFKWLLNLVSTVTVWPVNVRYSF